MDHMEDEPALPALSGPPGAPAGQMREWAQSKKRAHTDLAAQLFSNSSDPAVFSSDDDPALDNYTQAQRRKRRYVGPWFAQHPVSGDSSTGEEAARTTLRTATQRTLERQLDSGVWMGSDTMDAEDSNDVPRAQAATRMSELKPRERSGFQRVSSLIISSAEKTARQKIQLCIEEGIEDVYLKYV